MKIELNLKHEPSTYRGAALVIGVVLSLFYPELLERITAASVGVSGLIGMFFPDAPSINQE